MAHEQTRAVLWKQRERELLKVQVIDGEVADMQKRAVRLSEKRRHHIAVARHLEIAAITLDMKGTPS